MDEKNKGSSGKGDPKFQLIFIINGEDIEVTINPNQMLRHARDKALKDSGNEGRPFDEWEVRTEGGVLLNPSSKIDELGIEASTRLLLSLKVGAGGAVCSLTLR